MTFSVRRPQCFISHTKSQRLLVTRHRLSCEKVNLHNTLVTWAWDACSLSSRVLILTGHFCHFGFLWRLPLTTRSQTSVSRSRSPLPAPRFSNIHFNLLELIFSLRLVYNNFISAFNTIELSWKITCLVVGWKWTLVNLILENIFVLWHVTEVCQVWSSPKNIIILLVTSSLHLNFFSNHKKLSVSWIVSITYMQAQTFHNLQGSIFPVIPDDYNLVRTIKITSKVALWTSEVLLNHKIVQKFLYDFTYFPCGQYKTWTADWV